MTKIKAAVFASGTGSNFQALMEDTDLNAEIVLLVCDQPKAAVIDKASTYGIPVFIFNPQQYKTKEIYEEEILKQLYMFGVEWIFLAGYMRLIGSTLLDPFAGRIINIHPSLLPAFPGLDAIGQAIRAKVTNTGVTVHYVDHGMDTGPIIAQEDVDIIPSDTIETLTEKIQKVEHKLYPKTINYVMKKRGTHSDEKKSIN